MRRNLFALTMEKEYQEFLLDKLSNQLGIAMELQEGTNLAQDQIDTANRQANDKLTALKIEIVNKTLTINQFVDTFVQL